MKLAAVYNAFDGLENLKLSIDSIKDNVNLIEIVYGKYDNHAGEMAKRQAGIDRAVANGATHVIIMDCDEVYIPGEFKDTKEAYSQIGIDRSIVQMITYYKHTNVRFAEIEKYYVPFIQKVGRLVLNAERKCDPTRVIHSQQDKTAIVNNEIYMHHLSHVRDSQYSYLQKLLNSNAYPNFKDRVNQIAKEWQDFNPKTYDFSKPISIPGKGERKELLTLCEDIRKKIYG
jgi:hypothetical protein